jgi:hypothetical protein
LVIKADEINRIVPIGVFLIMNTKTIERLANRYAKDPIIRGLVQLIPMGIGSAADVALVTILENIREDRAREFFDELEKGAVQLTPEIIKKEDFLHAYFSTARAALNSRRREKIRYFARLLTSSISSSKISTIDEYEECLSILDELSFRELGILVVLSRYEKEYSHEAGESGSDRSVRFWDQFSSEVCSRFSIPPGELSSIITRLNGTGLYVTFTGYSSVAEKSLSYTGRIGELTPLYRKFEKLIRPEEGEFE